MGKGALRNRVAQLEKRVRAVLTDEIDLIGEWCKKCDPLILDTGVEAGKQDRQHRESQVMLSAGSVETKTTLYPKCRSAAGLR